MEARSDCEMDRSSRSSQHPSPPQKASSSSDTKDTPPDAWATIGTSLSTLCWLHLPCLRFLLHLFLFPYHLHRQSTLRQVSALRVSGLGAHGLATLTSKEHESKMRLSGQNPIKNPIVSPEPQSCG